MSGHRLKSVALGIASVLLASCEPAPPCTHCLDVAGTYIGSSNDCLRPLPDRKPFKLVQEGNQLLIEGSTTEDHATLLEDGTAKFTPRLHPGDDDWWDEGKFELGVAMTFKGEACSNHYDIQSESSSVTCSDFCWRRQTE